MRQTSNLVVVGLDKLFGGDDEDLLVSNALTWERDEATIASALLLWRAPEAFSTRVSRLRSMLDPTFAVDDGVRDQLFGGGDRDWFINYSNFDSFVDFTPKSSRPDLKN